MRLQPQESKTRKKTLRIKKKKRLVEESEILSDQTLKRQSLQEGQPSSATNGFPFIGLQSIKLGRRGEKDNNNN